METKLNIAEILKNKPKGTKLYTDAFGELSIRDIDIESEPSITLLDESGYILYFYSNGKYSLYGEPILFPSKKMRDWSKFAWKKGDVLVSNDGTAEVIFNGWKDDTYTLFRGAYALITHNDGKVEFGSDSLTFETCNYKGIEVEDAAQHYINCIEKRLGGKLNLETLEIEKTQPKFKDGDILSIQEDKEHYHTIFILKEGTDVYVFFDYFHRVLTYSTKIDENEKSICSLATEDEKKVLFAALEKENKAWDAEKKQIVNLKPKCEFKPFDKVVVRCSKADRWSVDFFSYKVSNGYICTGDAWFGYCLPYNEGTAKLIGTTNNAK